MDKKILITTWCTDDYRDLVGLDKLMNSVQYFHPDHAYQIETIPGIKDMIAKYK